MTKLSSVLLLLAYLTCIAHSDSGGPYHGVPDIKAGDRPIVFRNPNTQKSLSYYLSNIPKLKWDAKVGEPVSYSWTPIKGYHASFRVLGHVSGRQLYEVRYVSDKRISQGLDYTSAIVILARGFDTAKDKSLLTPIYYTSGGSVYNHTVEYLPKGHKYGAIAIKTHYSGNGNHISEIYIRGTEGFSYERFSPKTKKDNKQE